AGYAADVMIDLNAQPSPSAPEPTDSQLLVTRRLPDGSVDSTFGTSGVWTSTAGGVPGAAFRVALQADGKILGRGRRRATDGREEGVVVRLSSDGTIDSTFSVNGIYVLPWNAPSRLESVRVDASGRILATGRAWVDAWGY